MVSWHRPPVRRDAAALKVGVGQQSGEHIKEAESNHQTATHGNTSIFGHLVHHYTDMIPLHLKESLSPCEEL